MKKRGVGIVCCVATSLAISTTTWSASAEEGQEEAKASSVQEDFKPVALTLNPLTLILGRFGLNVEYLPAPHHGIMLNPYFSSASAEGSDIKTTYTSFGAELGYHFYLGDCGADGFFVGPQFVFLTSKAKDECKSNGCVLDDAEASFSAYGVAIDLGYQYVANSGFTIGVGGGAMYLKTSSSVSNTSSTVKFSGTIPRLLFTIGYSF